MTDPKKRTRAKKQSVPPEFDLQDERPIETAKHADEARAVDVTDDLGVDQSGAGLAEGIAPEPGFEPPDELPILPLRGLVVYPQTTIPLTVGQPRSIKLVDEVVTGDRLVGLVASRNPDLETPGPDDIYDYGTVAQIHRLFRAPDGTIRLLVQGMARIKIDEYTNTEPYLHARVSPAPETVEDSIEVEALMRNVVEQFSRMAELVPSIPGELINAALNVDDPLQLVYALATYIRLNLEDQQNLLRLDSVLEKLRTLMAILNKELEVLELGRKIQIRSPV